MEVYSFLYRGKRYEIGDTIKLGWFQKWKIVDILDNSTAILERGKKYKSIEGKTKVMTF